ncbi:SprB repeat-containing protein, partial [Arenibacter antarcticus]
AGNFYVVLTATDAPFCPATSNIVTIGSPDAALDLLVTKNINANCNIGAQVTVKASGGNGGYTYAFVQDGSIPNPSDYTASASAILDPATNLNWDVWVKDAKDCLYRIDVVIAADPLPTVTVPAYADDQCTSTGNSYTFTATGLGVGPLKFRIDNKSYQSSGTFTVTAPGTYQVTVMDANGCTVTDTLLIYGPLAPNSQVIAQPSCADNDGIISVTANGGSGNYEYELQDAFGATLVPQGASNTFPSLGAGDYLMVVHDTTTGCNSSAPISLEAASPVIFTWTKEDVSCNGGADGSIQVILDAANDNPPYTFTIFDGTTT